MITEWQQDSLPVASTDLLNRPEAWSDHPNYYTTFGVNSLTPAGKNVSPESALRVSAVMACVRVIAETIASLPITVYREDSDGDKVKDRKHEIYKLLGTKKGRPNKWQTAFEFREMMTGHLALRGNAYSEIVYNGGGGIVELLPIHPDRVEVERLENGRLRYRLRSVDGMPEQTLTQDEILHVRWFSSDGITGLSPIMHAANAVGLAQATEEHGSTLFKNGARPGGILHHPGKLPPEAPDQLRHEWNKLHQGSGNAHGLAVTQGNMTYQEIGITPEDAQYLETRKFQAEDIARIYRVPLHMINILDHATFTNIEHQSIDFVKFTMAPWLARWETTVDRDLIIDEDVYFEHNVDGLLRGDSVARFQQYQIGLQNRIYKPNDVKRLENLETDEDGENYLVPANASAESQRQQNGETEEPEEDESQENQALAAMLADASKRIASAELRELEKRAKHAASDPVKFSAWVTEYYSGKYAAYVTQTVTPIYNAFSLTGVEDAVKAVAGDGMVTLTTGVPVDVYEDWKDSRESALTNILREKAHVS